ncbi:MAG: hypothetical protein IJ079_03020 [Lachnospiraceae bacterium]|nr:hypothetical protein [Lachnospiraceae bacterium]
MTKSREHQEPNPEPDKNSEMDSERVRDQKQVTEDRQDRRKRGVAGGVLRVLVIGLTGMAAGVLAVFVICMIRRYGIKDLNKRDYLETSRFADSMMEQIAELNIWLGVAQIYESGEDGGSIASMDSLVEISRASDSDVVSLESDLKPGIQLSQSSSLTYDQFVNNISSYNYETDENGNIYLIDNSKEYNANWYSSILLSDYQLRSSNSFIEIPSSAYIELAYQMMEPNAVAVSSLDDEALKEALISRHYHSSLSRVEDYLNGNASFYESYDSVRDLEEDMESDAGMMEDTTSLNAISMTEATTSMNTMSTTEAVSIEVTVSTDDISVKEYDDEILNQILADVRIYDDYLYIDNKFSSDAYITTISGANEILGFDPGEMTLVYSPIENKFYSSYYGWYMIPDEIYYLSRYIASDLNMNLGGADNNGKYEISGEIPGEALFWLPFADSNSLLRVKLGENYTDYLQAERNLNNRQQNFLYYLERSDKEYDNGAEDIASLGAYMIITKLSADDLEAGMNDDQGSENASPYYTYKFSVDDQYGYGIQMINFDNSYLINRITRDWTNSSFNMNMEEGDRLFLAIRPDYSYYDEFSLGFEQFNMYYKYMIPACVLVILLLAATVVLVLISIKRTGCSGDSDKNEIYFLDRWPIEVMWLAVFTSLFFMVVFLILTRNQIYQYMVVGWVRSNLIVFLATCGFYYLMVLLGMTGFLSLIRRLRVKEYQKISIFRMLGGRLRSGLRVIAGQRNLVAQTVELYLGYWLLLIISIFMILALTGIWPFLGLFLFVLLHIGMLILSIRKAKGEQMIRTVTEELAAGNLEVEVPKGRPLEVERQILENIEHLGDGLHTALEQSIYDERMKAELITNVSHDIKTPLTSIINYVDLLKREDIENEEVRHYIEVLDQKSRRLKQLTEDLVEVSKISSGNIELECMPIDLGELVRQSVGEFQDKFEEHKLQIVDNIAEEPCMIFADGRRTYRVMDNLMQNVYKYAMPNTRVYIDLMHSEETVIFSIKNISQAELNIDARELMERFIRGDQSRSTEGSGLGLSIAKDLVHMQNGAFDILLDGDLFKVTIMFPMVSQ